MSPPAATPAAVSRRSMAVAALSTVVEWYDFTLYLYLATVLSRVFYGGGAVALGTTLAGFALAYLMRPLGAIAFGHIGDRYGRRRMMLLSMAVMTVAMLATALLPTRDQIGPMAGWLLLLLRCVMAFSVGGEYTGVVAYLLEGARPERRGLVTSTAAAASEVGGLLAAGVAALTVGTMSVATLDGWGWRIPFLFGAALAAAVWLARSTMQESPEFERQATQGSVPRNPLRMSLSRHRIGILRGFAISALGSITYYVGITYVPAFLTETGGVGEATALWLSTGAALVVVMVTPLVGLLTDRVGRRPVLLGLCGAAALLPAAMFGMMASGGLALAVAGTMILAMLGGGVSAVGAVATAEQFPGEGRLTGLALGVTSATAIFGGLAPYVAHRLIAWSGSPLMPGLMIAVVALGLLPILLRMNETRPA
ncbi:MHS family proline/betaine transporter-like MFS transporter [Sphingomonas sp. SORGH_AS802]|uniref:MFS transporter n=2 Tax=unclassified Sphingomonas TaxID=196159 RepID=UPI00285DC53A|nr:MFS transporter [Sphingomonas sp. SORGH_AS_0802]MDR6133066.1 MHS family proline/betaine transporter-like MFS transporter [Sphingomonas sp. SORGH_AS_0802]